MKRQITLLCALLLLLALPASATRLMIVSDIHYLAPSLYKGSDLFLRALRAGDGKLTHRGEALMAALRDEAADIMPDALIVTGDLAFNGERASHAALAKWFARIEALGIPVWVLPGNHDINVTSAKGFAGDGWYATESVTPEEFSGIYADFMLPPEGSAGLSYAVSVDDGLCLAMADVAFYQGGAQTFGLFTAAHGDWLRRVLTSAGDAEVITATHHNLLPHTEFSRDSYLMFGSESMVRLAEEYGLRLNLSGHLHAQSIREQGGLTDAATGAFCAWPHRYALLTRAADGSMTYEARSLSAGHLPEGFLDMSRAWYIGISKDKTLAALSEVDPGDAERMADFAARLGLAYFSGTYRSDDPAWREDPAYALWDQRGNDAAWQTMKLVMEEPSGENLLRSWKG